MSRQLAPYVSRSGAGAPVVEMLPPIVLRVPERAPARGHRDLRTAWAAVASLPLAAFTSLLVLKLVAALAGHPGTSLIELPLRTGAVVLAPAEIVVLVPCLVAWLSGRRAVRAGENGGWAPAVLGVGAGVLHLGLVGFALLLTRAWA